MRPAGTRKNQWYKNGSWSESELFYMVNHVATLTGVYGSFEMAVEETSRRISRKPSDIKRRYKDECNKSCYRAG
jgi:hypothetical protein